VTKAYNATLNVYECPEDRYHHYCLGQSNPASMFLGRLPFFLHAIDAAGLKFEPDTSYSVMPCRGGRVDRHDKWLKPPRGWSNAGLTVLARTKTPTNLSVVIEGPKQFGSFRGHYMLFHGFPRLNVPSDRASLRERQKRQAAAAVQFTARSLFDDPPDQRNVGTRRGDKSQRFPYVERAGNDPEQRLYHLEYSGDNINLPVLCDAEGQPLRQVLVIPRTVYWNAQVREASWRVKGAMRAYVRALDEQAVIKLNVESVHRRYWMPTTVKITDAKGRVVIDSSVFMAGTRSEVDVVLDPGQNPSPWKFEMASSGDCAVTFAGAEELFFALRPEEFDEILPYLLTPGK